MKSILKCLSNYKVDEDINSSIDKSEIPTATVEHKTNIPEENEHEVIWEIQPVSYEDEYRDAEGNLLIGVDPIEKGDSLQYINKDAGYSIDIPLEYKNYLLIIENDEWDRLEFRFYGQSVIGRGWHYYSELDIGIYLFSIVDEEYIQTHDGRYDIYGLIGTINNVNYYAVSSTDFTLSVLVSEVRYIEDGTSYFQDNEQEMQLVIDDREIADKMYDEIRSIMATFTALN